MVQVSWTERARKDLDAISAYIAESSPYYAEQTERGIYDKALTLEQQPMIGHVVLEVGDPGDPEIAYGRYRIIHWVKSREHLVIIAVVHGKRSMTRRGIVSRRRSG